MKKLLFVFALILLSTPCYAQGDGNLTILYESPQGFGIPAMLDSATVVFRDRNDPNGDGLPDLTMLREDASGTPVEVVTYDVVNRRKIWSLPVSTIVEALGTDQFRFLGFFSFSTDPNAVWALFRAPNGGTFMVDGVEITDKRRAINPIVLPAQRLATLDLNGDGAMELIIQNSETRTVQVWGGSNTSTAVEEEIEAAMVQLFQNYPNPFHDRTTIAYAVEHPGPVTVTVYDLLGRHVRTLVDETQPVGTYEVGWNGQDAAGQPVASGTYFYRLRVGDAVSSKQALRIQ